MNKKLLLKSLLLASLFSITQANENFDRNSVYVGINTDFLSFGGDSLDVSTTQKNKTINKVIYRDIDSSPTTIKIGYEHFCRNRVEVYARFDDIQTDGGDISTNTYGINYELGFSSLANDGQLLPYLLLGAGTGSASSDKLKRVDDADIVELNLGFGLHYKIDENIDTTFSYSHRAMLFVDVPKDQNGDIDISDLSKNNIGIGISYHF